MASKLLDELKNRILELVSIAGVIVALAIFFVTMSNNIAEIKTSQQQEIKEIVNILKRVENAFQIQIRMEAKERRHNERLLEDLSRAMTDLNKTLIEIKYKK